VGTHLAAPFPGPAVSLSEAVSPADSVFSHNSGSSNDTSEQGSTSNTSDSEQRPVTQNVDLEIKGIEKTGPDVVISTSPQDIAKIEALHNSISDLASHFATILFSERGEEVLASSQ